MSDDTGLIERVARVLATSNIASIYKRGATPSEADHYWPSFEHDAQATIAAVRAYDAERRATDGMIDAAQAPKSDPDDYRDPFTLVTKMSKAPGIREE